ncbi:MAG: hypothetical protein K0B81_03300 [Candidatus Cloacimonetes bacterium]|nr:hypothetical protein [Candidatus Cloacimonadota bacterium]
MKTKCLSSLRKNLTLKLILLLLFVIISQIIGCTKREREIVADKFLLQKSLESISINSYIDSEIVELDTYPIDEYSLYATDGIEYTVVVDIEMEAITIYGISENTIKIEIVPYNFEINTVTLYQDKVFLGGYGPTIAQYSINTGEWFSLEMSDDIVSSGKAVDDFLVEGHKLMAVDNLVFPKYMLIYKLKGAQKARLSNVIELQENGPYEQIFQARMNDRYIGMLSTSFSNYTGKADHLTIYDKKRMKKSFTITSTEKDELGLNDNDIRLVRDADNQNMSGSIGIGITPQDIDNITTLFQLMRRPNVKDFLLIRDRLIIMGHKRIANLLIDESLFGTIRHKRVIPEGVISCQVIPIDEPKQLIGLTLIPNSNIAVATIVDQDYSFTHQIMKFYGL